jgi:hypothetical protein
MRINSWIMCGAFMLSAAWGCRSEKRRILPKDKMQAVMWDMMRADKFLSDYVLSRDTSKKKDSESIKLYQQVLAIHRVNGEQFSESLQYYKERPDELRQIMDSISKPPVTPPAETVQPLPAIQADTSSGKQKDTIQARKIKKVFQAD